MRATQRYEQVVISGLAHVDAPQVVTSTEIEDQLAATLERLGVEPGAAGGPVRDPGAPGLGRRDSAQ